MGSVISKPDAFCQIQPRTLWPSAAFSSLNPSPRYLTAAPMNPEKRLTSSISQWSLDLEKLQTTSLKPPNSYCVKKLFTTKLYTKQTPAAKKKKMIALINWLIQRSKSNRWLMTVCIYSKLNDMTGSNISITTAKINLGKFKFWGKSHVRNCFFTLQKNHKCRSLFAESCLK